MVLDMNHCSLRQIALTSLWLVSLMRAKISWRETSYAKLGWCCTRQLFRAIMVFAAPWSKTLTLRLAARYDTQEVNITWLWKQKRSRIEMNTDLYISLVRTIFISGVLLNSVAGVKVGHICRTRMGILFEVLPQRSHCCPCRKCLRHQRPKARGAVCGHPDSCIAIGPQQDPGTSTSIPCSCMSTPSSTRAVFWIVALGFWKPTTKSGTATWQVQK
jgi:hypothetical protein